MCLASGTGISTASHPSPFTEKNFLRTLSNCLPQLPGDPASVTCCLLSTRPANNHSPIMCLLSLWHRVTVAGKIYPQQYSTYYDFQLLMELLFLFVLKPWP